MSTCGGEVFSDDDYTADPTFFVKAVAQVEALLTYFEQKYDIKTIRNGVIEVAHGNQPFGEEDTELFKSLNFLSSSHITKNPRWTRQPAKPT